MTDALRASIAAIWQKSIPQTCERMVVLQRAADELSTSRSIDPELRAEALSIAHKLAGSLGMFGFNDATDLARAIESTLDNDGLPQPERLQEQVAALRTCMQSRLET